ncbi:ABC transporter ATP-binding protein [Saccharothrix sp. AJ9571]|nr:ABC transporter ATP-binding protein [Saccharothrix sp. AJ9571]
MSLELHALTVVLSGKTVIDDVAITVQPGQVTGVVGPNGSGKSTLLRTIYQYLSPQRGVIRHDDVNLATLRPTERAQRIAAVPQHTDSGLEGTVRDVVALGRTPYKRPFSPDTDRDRQIVADSLRQTDMYDYAERLYATLSGGEQQRTLLARALAQQTPALVLDEPTNHLDARHQLHILELVRDLGRTTLLALHDLSLAARYCDQIVVMNRGRVVASGRPVEVLTPGLLATVFGVSGELIDHPRTGDAYLLLAPLH